MSCVLYTLYTFYSLHSTLHSRVSKELSFFFGCTKHLTVFLLVAFEKAHVSYVPRFGKIAFSRYLRELGVGVINPTYIFASSPTKRRLCASVPKINEPQSVLAGYRYGTRRTYCPHALSQRILGVKGSRVGVCWSARECGTIFPNRVALRTLIFEYLAIIC